MDKSILENIFLRIFNEIMSHFTALETLNSLLFRRIFVYDNGNECLKSIVLYIFDAFRPHCYFHWNCSYCLLYMCYKLFWNRIWQHRSIVVTFPLLVCLNILYCDWNTRCKLMVILILKVPLLTHTHWLSVLLIHTFSIWVILLQNRQNLLQSHYVLFDG